MQGRIYDERSITLYYMPRDLYYQNFKKNLTPPAIIDKKWSNNRMTIDNHSIKSTIITSLNNWNIHVSTEYHNVQDDRGEWPWHLSEQLIQVTQPYKPTYFWYLHQDKWFLCQPQDSSTTPWSGSDQLPCQSVLLQFDRRTQSVSHSRWMSHRGQHCSWAIQNI